MRQRALVSLGLLIASAAAVQVEACSNTIEVQPIDASTSEPDLGPLFTLSLSPGHLTEDIGDTFAVTLKLNRQVGFGDQVSFAISAPSELALDTTAPAPMQGIYTGSTTFQVTALAMPASGQDVTVTVTGTSGSTVETATLGVRIGSTLFPDDAGVIEIPSFVSALSTVTAKLWGAGGGGGQDCMYDVYNMVGGRGGGGGTALHSFAVTPGEVFRTVVGTGGTGVTAVGNGGGAGGGGYSALLAADGGVILLVGGGGGGTAAYCQTSPPDDGTTGGWGGGTQGGQGGNQGPSGGGGLPDAGGDAGGNGMPGTAWMGGAGGGGGTAIPAGVPGGAPGNSLGGGGGGGGLFGGGGGGEAGLLSAGGGGGGSGFATNPLDFGALDLNDPDRGDADIGQGTKTNGGAGRVIIKLPKP